MLAIEPALKSRLQSLPQLATWAVRTGTDAADRRQLPAADLRCTGAAVQDRKTGAVLIAPEWLITLVVRRSDVAVQQLDAALSGVIESLHSWAPGQHGGRGWEPLALARITEMLMSDEGLAGYELTFTTGARYKGQQ